MILNCSTCFERHTAHHQEVKKTVIAASGFTYVSGCRPLRWLSHVKTEPAITVFELLMMGGVSPKHVEQLMNIGIINSITRSHLVGSFYEFYASILPYHAQITSTRSSFLTKK